MRYVSKITCAPVTAERAYAWLSDMENLRPLQDWLTASAGKLPMGLEVERVEFASDSVSVFLKGHDPVSLTRIDGEPDKTLKFAVRGAGKDITLWVQLLEKTPGTTHFRLTAEADLPFLLRKMLGDKIQNGTDAVADALARLPYNG